MTLTRPSCEKPIHGDGQTFKTCRSEGASQNLEHNAGLFSPKPIINPRPAPLFEKTEQI